MKNILTTLGCRIALVLVMALATTKIEAQTLATVAGMGGTGYNGDGIAATAAQLYQPRSVAIDGAGNIIIADTENDRLRKVSTSGIISTIAGTGVAGDGGDGGPATAAQINYPLGVTTDAAGNIIFSSGFNIRKIDTSGIIRTICGTGTMGFTGDGGPATAASTGMPSEIVVDGSGNIYFADVNNYRIRKIDTSGIITTIAGTGTSGFSGDGGPATAAKIGVVFQIAVDAAGNLFIADANARRIRKINTSGIISTVAGNGSYAHSGDGGRATAAGLSSSNGVCVNSAGVLYITEDTRIRKVNASGVISTIAGAGRLNVKFYGEGIAATAAWLCSPSNIKIDASGNLYFGEINNSRVRKINTAGIISTVAGTANAGYSGDGGPGTAAQLCRPYGVAVARSGKIYIADSYNERVRMLDTFGILTTIAGNDTPGSTGDGGPATAAKLGGPQSVYVDTGNNIYVAENSNCRIRKINSSGIISTIAGTGTVGFSGDGGPATAAKIGTALGMAMDAAGNLYIADVSNNRIRKVSTSGIITTFAGRASVGFGGDGGPATAALLDHPTDCAFDASGNLYIVDCNNGRIRKVTPSGIISTFAGSSAYCTSGGDGGPATAACLGRPYGLAIDSWGNIFISDPEKNKIRKIASSGIITTVAGTGGAGCTGDGGPATAGQMLQPGGLALDVNGNLFFGDAGNNTIRKVNNCTYPYAAAISGGDSVCEGNSITLTDTTSGGTWTTSTTSVASVHPSTGVVTGVATGTVTISYTVTNGCGSAFATKAITVNPLPHAATITGASTVYEDSSITLTDSTTGGTWTSGASSIASVNGSTGVVTGIATGSVTISYTVTNSCGTASITKGLTVTGPIAGTISGPTGVCVSATISLSDAVSGGTWSSNNPAKATISSTGVVTGVAAGTTTITYQVGSAFATQVLTISTSPTISAIAGGSSVCPAGGVLTLTEATAGGVWSSLNTALATVSPAGVVTGVASGRDTIRYTITNFCGSFFVPKAISVTAPSYPATIAGSAAGLCTGSTITYTDGTTGGVWSSSNPSVATVNSSGIVTGVMAGTDTISYTITNSCGQTGAALRTVTINAPASAGSITGASNICTGGTVAYTTTGTAGGAWTSSNAAAATISSTGVVTPVSASATTLRYTVTNACGTNAASLYLTVSAPGAPAAISGPLFLCAGSSVTFTDATASGTWSSSVSSVATISSTGVVTGLANGATVITYTVTNACGTYYAARNLAVNVTVPVVSISGSPTVLVGGSITLSHSGPTGVWSSVSPSVATISGTGVVTGAAAGVDTIKYTVINGCGTTIATKAITVTAHRGAGGMVEHDEPVVSLYPNPTRGLVTIKLLGTSGDAAISVTDLSGKTLLSMISPDELIELNLSNVAAGVYLVNVKTPNSVYTEKLIVQ